MSSRSVSTTRRRCMLRSRTFKLVGVWLSRPRAKRERVVWLLFMAASANRFDDGGLAVHQILGLTSSPGRPQWNAIDSSRLGLSAFHPGQAPFPFCVQADQSGMVTIRPSPCGAIASAITSGSV